MTRPPAALHEARSDERTAVLAPTETPLRPLCPSCGAHHLTLRTRVEVDFDVAAPLPLGDVQVLGHHLVDADWDDDAELRCRRCAWRGRAADLHGACTAP